MDQGTLAQRLFWKSRGHGWCCGMMTLKDSPENTRSWMHSSAYLHMLFSRFVRSANGVSGGRVSTIESSSP